MTWSLVFAYASREARAARRRVGLYGGAITLGVAALVAINAFRADLTDAIRAQSRELLGADLALRSSAPLPDSAIAVLDSLASAGARVARITRLSSMVLAPRSGLTRLADVRAVARGYPFYGSITTSPPGQWERFDSSRVALVDPALLVHLNAQVGDTLRIGDAAFAIAGTLSRLPGEMDLQAMIAPRVVIGERFATETGLLEFGSRVGYSAYVRLPNPADADPLVERYRDAFRDWRVRATSARDREQDYARTYDVLGRFLGLVGLAALLLGGVGIASAVHVFVVRRLDTVAVLRCLGADRNTVLATYVLLAAGMSTVGAATGAVLGVLVQSVLPAVLRDFLPVPVETHFHLGTVLLGVGVGTWVAAVFAALPLLRLRSVPPLRALRRAVEPFGRRFDAVHVAAWSLLALSVLGLAVAQAPRSDGWEAGPAFVLGFVVVTLVLWGAVRLLTSLTRRAVPRWLPFATRQGLANLFRPHNQSVAVTLAIGFGVFLLASVQVVQHNLVDQLSFTTGGAPPDLAVFDIQRDQIDGVRQILVADGVDTVSITPIVPARIAAINGRDVADIRADTSEAKPERWALRHEYRNTYRDTMVSSESLVEGRWWGPRSPEDSLPRISIEDDVAHDLRVGVGDRITWTIEGTRIQTRIANIRRVEWARFEPNFFVVFEPGTLESAPQTAVALARVGDATRRAVIQRDLVARYPNLSSIDASLVRETLDRIIGSVVWAIRFMALFSLLAGLIVLASAVATSRAQRVAESVLLRTLGARSGTIARMVATEYTALGLAAGVLGAGLAAIGGWLLVTRFFGLEFDLPIPPLAAFVVGAALLATAIGFLGSREVLRRPPLAVLRELAE